MDGRNYGVGAHLFDVSFAKLIQVGRCKLQPPRKWIAPDYCGLQGPTFFPMRNRGGRFRGGRRVLCWTHWLTVQPASTVTIWPVIGLDSRCRRKQAALVISSALIKPLVRGCLCDI